MRSIVGAVALALGLATAGIVPATAAPADSWETRAMIEAYQRDYPGLTRGQAVAAREGQEQRIAFLEQLQAQQPDSFGGSWYDPRTDTEHVNVVGSASAASVQQTGAKLGLHTTTHQVALSLKDLVSVAVQTQSKVDVIGNRLVAANAGAAQQQAVPETCTDRLHCGTPLRSGIVLWAQGLGNVCSLGFTARATDSSRWAVTAGHCGTLTGDGGIWGHGEQTIGPIRYGRDSGNIDVARIHVTGSYWSTGGYFFNANTPNTPLPVDYAITYRGTIQVGDAVCLSAWHSTVGNACGTIVDAFGSRNMPQVSFDACPGDSGGGWYFLTSSGTRWAYGIHHGQPDNTTLTCHNHAANDSIFTALPDLNDWWDSTTAATLRVEYR
jgi:streptogrisin C